MPETYTVPTWSIVIVGLGTTFSTIIGIFVTAWSSRRAAKDAKDAAELVAKVALKTEEVKIELKTSGRETTEKLNSIERIGEKTHTLVNNALSEQLKKYLIMTELLLATNPENVIYQRFVSEAHEAVEAHAPAESSTDTKFDEKETL